MKQQYFDFLNYSLGNEDSELEGRIAEFYQSQFILAVCGSGGRSLPLLAYKAKHLSVFDISDWQISLAKLRAYTYQYLNYEEFLIFWGYVHNATLSDHEIKKMRKEVIHGHKQVCLSEGERWQEYFSNFSWESILYNGRWERAFKFLATISTFILGSNASKLFSFDTLAEQVLYLNNGFPLLRWRIIVFLLGNKSVFNAILYRGAFVKKNIKESYFEHYWQAFQRLFSSVLVKESFFLNLCFFGKIQFVEGNPWEAKEKVFFQIQKKIKEGVNINYINCSLSELQSHDSVRNIKYDLISLSNVPSYLPTEKQLTFLQDLKPFLSPGGIVVVRYYLNIANPSLISFKDVSSFHQDLILKEKVQMYHIKIYQYMGDI